MHRCLRQRAALPRALDDYLVDALWIARVLQAALADRSEKVDERVVQPLLHFDVADRALAIALLQVVDFALIRIENVVACEDRIAFALPPDRPFNPALRGD